MGIVINELAGLNGYISLLSQEDQKFKFNNIKIKDVEFKKANNSQINNKNYLEFEIMENKEFIANFQQLDYISKIKEDKTLTYEIKLDNCMVTINNKKLFCEFKLTDVWLDYFGVYGDSLIIETGGNTRLILKEIV